LGAGGPTPPAGATTAEKAIRVSSAADCPDHYMCFWGDSYYRGRYLFSPSHTDNNIGNFMNDLTTSMWNRTGYHMCFFPDTNLRGEAVSGLRPGQWSPNVGTGANDRISSWGRCWSTSGDFD
jgi:hypothetical protein